MAGVVMSLFAVAVVALLGMVVPLGRAFVRVRVRLMLIVRVRIVSVGGQGRTDRFSGSPSFSSSALTLASSTSVRSNSIRMEPRDVAAGVPGPTGAMLSNGRGKLLLRQSLPRRY